MATFICTGRPLHFERMSQSRTKLPNKRYLVYLVAENCAQSPIGILWPDIFECVELFKALYIAV